MSASPVRADRSYGAFVAPGALFGVVWLAAVVETHLAAGLDGGDLVRPPVVLAGVALTCKLTRPTAPVDAPGGCVRAQLGFLAAYTALSIASALHNHGALESPVFAPLDQLAGWLQPIVGVSNRVVNPLLDIVIPGLVLCVLGASLRELGLTRGRHTLRVAALWCAIPIAYLVQGMALGSLTASTAGRNALEHTMQNGPGEEIYWRGFLQTRLAWFGSGWAIAVTALVCGLSHLGAQLDSSGGDALLAGARCITDQAIVSVGLGVMVHRTRSVIASSVFHVLLNTCITGAG